MIYLKNNNEQQTIFIPRNELQKEAYITSTKTYEDGYREGLEDGKEQQKDQLLNLYVTENGQYEREDGWGTVAVDIPIGDCPECEDCSGAYDEGYEIGKNEGYEDGFQDGYDQGQADCPQGDDCPELTTIDITENGSYEGAFNLVNVNVPQDGGSCILEDKRIAPSMGDRDGNGYIVVEESEGYDGLSRVVINPQQIYNEGIEEGRNQGGGSGDCNIQIQKRVDLNGEWETYYPDEGYDGIYEVVVDASRMAEEWREEGRNDIRNQLQTIEITENGRYSVGDEFHILSLWYRDGYHTDTISTYDINRIEVTFKAATSESINGQGQPFILGGSLYGVNESGEDNACARAIQYAYGRIVGYWEGKWTDAVSNMDGEWITITLDENGMTVKYPTRERYCEYTHDNGHRNGGGDIFPFIIGGQGRRKYLEDGNFTSNLIEDSQFRGDIKEVKITTNSMGEITYIPNGRGVWERKVENTGEYLSALEPTEGEVTLTVENGKKYGEGWREINVNVDGGSCNFEDKWVTPSMADRDDNGYIVVDQSEGFDGLDRVVIDPTTIYNEGVSAGKAEGEEDCEQRYNEGYNEGYTDGYYEGSNQLSNNVLEGDMVLSFQLNDNNFPDLRNDGKGIFSWDGYKVPLYIKKPNGCGELYLSGNYDKNIAPSLQSKFFQDDDYAKIEKLTINFYHIIPNNIVNVVNLKELHLTERVEIIDKNAFQDVSNLKTIYCHYDGDAYMYATKESFVGLPNNGTLYVKKSQQPSWGWIEDLGWTIVNI